MFRFPFSSPFCCVCKLHGHQQGPSAVLGQPLEQSHRGGGAGTATEGEGLGEPQRGRSREGHEGGGAGRTTEGAEPGQLRRGRGREGHGRGGAGRATKGQEPGVLPALPSHWPNYFLNFILPGREVVGANSHKQCLYLKFKKKLFGNSLAVQWLEFHAFIARGLSSIPVGKLKSHI